MEYGTIQLQDEDRPEPNDTLDLRKDRWWWGGGGVALGLTESTQALLHCLCLRVEVQTSKQAKYGTVRYDTTRYNRSVPEISVYGYEALHYQDRHTVPYVTWFEER
eukprot:jgi/Psemu1/301213/fgenesh1_kg.27_\